MKFANEGVDISNKQLLVMTLQLNFTNTRDRKSKCAVNTFNVLDAFCGCYTIAAVSQT